MKKISACCLAITLFFATAHLFGQGTKQRLTGYRYNDGHFLQLSDTFRFTYANGRGSIDKENILFDTKTTADMNGDKERVLSQFDINNNPIVGEYQQNISSNWLTVGRYNISYNAANKMTERIFEQLYNNVWYNSMRYTATYNTHNDTTSEIQYQPDTAGNWVMASKVIYNYDNKRQHTTTFMYSGTAQNPNDTSYALYYTYDTEGNIIALEEQTSDTANRMVPLTLTENQYDTAHRIINRLQKNYENGAWVPDNQFTFYYNAMGRITRERSFISDNGGLTPFRQYLYTYNTLGVKDTFWWQEYDNNTADFKGVSRNIYTYNADTTLAEDARQDPNQNGVWLPAWKFSYQYNTAKNLTYERMTQQAGWPADTPGGEWFYYYEDYTIVSGISQVTSDGFNVYPNPAHNYFNIALNPGQFKSLQLVSVIGETVLKQDINEAAATIFVPTLQVDTGMYLLQLFDGKSITASKVMIE